MSNTKARFWILTIPKENWNVPTEISDPCTWLRGQLEHSDTGYDHWQLVVGCVRQVRLPQIKKIFGSTAHAEPTRSQAANDYVWKDSTAVPGSRFELGTKPIRRNNLTDWDHVKSLARRGDLDGIPPDIYVRNYGNLRRICVDNVRPVAVPRTTLVLWGKTGTGKTKSAWEECGLDAYPKDPNTKFWDGYRGQSHVIIDEFRGAISISHLLRWLDRYPCLVEIKGSSTVLKAERFIITSNLHPKDWYPELDENTYAALARRIEIKELVF